MVAEDFSRVQRIIDNDVNNKRKRLPENLEDLDRDPPDGLTGIAFFLSHCDRQVSHNGGERAKNQ